VGEGRKTGLVGRRPFAFCGVVAARLEKNQKKLGSPEWHLKQYRTINIHGGWLLGGCDGYLLDYTIAKLCIYAQFHAING
jgi:hypothetical protein